MSDEVNVELNETETNESLNEVDKNSKPDEEPQTEQNEDIPEDADNENIIPEPIIENSVNNEKSDAEETKLVDTDDIKTDTVTEDADTEINLTLEYDDVELLGDEIKVIDDSEAKVDDLDKSDSKDKKDDDVKKESTKDKDDTETSEKQSPVGRSLWVSGLSLGTRANDLKKHFLTQGRVIGAKVVSHSRTPGSRCYGYIVMSTSQEADLCVKNLHHSKLLNRFISVKKAKNEKPESADTKSVSSNTLDNTTDKQDKTKRSEEKSSDRSKSKTESKDSKNKNDESIKKAPSDSGRRHSSKESERKRRDSKERPRTEKRSSRERERERRLENERKMQRIREEREKERLLAEERRIRETKRRQREEASRLERERQQLRLERERLHREKMELIRLEKEQLDKEREELKRQKQKIADAQKKKDVLERDRHLDRTKRRRERTPPPPRRNEIPPPKISKKHEMDKYVASERHFNDKRKDIKYKDTKDYRSNYKSEYNRGEPSKYDRYQDEKKMGMKSGDDFMKGMNVMNFEPPPPRISSNDATRFNVVPLSHSQPFPSSTNRFRDDFHGKDMFVPIPNSRNVDRVSDRFPVDRPERRVPNDNMDLGHRSRGNYPGGMEFPKSESSRMPVSSRGDRLEQGRMGREDMHMDPISMRRNNGGSYHEPDRDLRHRSDNWYGSGGGNGPVQKRMPPPMQNHRGEPSWGKGNHGNIDSHSWENSRHYDNFNRPGGYPSGSDRGSKLDRH